MFNLWSGYAKPIGQLAETKVKPLLLNSKHRVYTHKKDPHKKITLYPKWVHRNRYVGTNIIIKVIVLPIEKIEVIVLPPW